MVIEADHVSKSFGDRLLVEDLNFNLPKGGIVGVIGANGAGKTTLFNMMAGREPVRQVKCAWVQPLSPLTLTKAVML